MILKGKLIKVNINVKHAEDLYRKAVKILKGEMPECSKECVYCKWGGWDINTI